MSQVEEKIIYIRRKPSKRMAKNEALKMMDNNSMKYMGAAAYGNTGLPITGLSEVEKTFIMPSLVQVAATHNEFDLAVNNYFHELREPVNAGKGLRLDITTEKKEVIYAGEKETIDFPRNPKDYVLYRRAKDSLYKQCADNFELAKDGGERVKFYIHDVEAAQKVEVALGDARDKAFAAYLDIVDNNKVWEPILLIHNINPDVLSKVEQKAKLRELAEATSVVDAKDKLAALEKFTKATEDKDLETKSNLIKFINAKIVLVVGTSYIYDNGTATTTIGNSEKEAVLWLKDAKNSKDAQIMLATLNKQ